MKKIIIAILISLCIPTSAFAKDIVSSNLDGITITPINDTSEGVKTKITYKDGYVENIDANYIALFVNSSLIRDSNVIIEENRALVPVRAVTENLGYEVKWTEETGEVEIYNDKTNVNLKIGSKTAAVNDEKIELDAAPKIYNNFTYVPIRFLADSLNFKVDYFDGKNLETTHIVPRIPQIIVSSYDSYDALSKAEAVEIVKKQLIEAYNLTYGEYIPWDENETYKNNGDDIRKAIYNLNVTEENDRFYTIPVVFDFWVDKYTGEVYVFYNGMTMVIYKFDPTSKGALTFAG